MNVSKSVWMLTHFLFFKQLNFKLLKIYFVYFKIILSQTTMSVQDLILFNLNLRMVFCDYSKQSLLCVSQGSFGQWKKTRLEVHPCCVVSITKNRKPFLFCNEPTLLESPCFIFDPTGFFILYRSCTTLFQQMM